MTKASQKSHIQHRQFNGIYSAIMCVLKALALWKLIEIEDDDSFPQVLTLCLLKSPVLRSSKMNKEK